MAGYGLVKWAAEHDVMLRTHWLDGVSSSQSAKTINNAFGTAYSRNAVIGRRSRVGLLGTNRTPSNPGGAHKALVRASPPRIVAPKPKPEPKAKPDNIEAFNINRKLAATVLPLPPERPTSGPRVAMEDLQRHHCRYPLGDPRDHDFGFCGAVKAGSTYCAHHQHLTTTQSQPAKPRLYDPSSDRRQRRAA